jgi:hypothetical protein
LGQGSGPRRAAAHPTSRANGAASRATWTASPG